MTPTISRITMWATVTVLCMSALTAQGTAARAPETVIHASPNSGGVTARAAAAKVAMAAGVSAMAGIPTPGGAILKTGNLSLGVNPEGNINTSWNGGWVGLAAKSPVSDEQLDALAPGCLCEGWGIADTNAPAVSGWASWDDGGVSANLTLTDWEANGTDQTAKSVVSVAGPGALPWFTVTHDFHPQTSNLFAIDVTVENTSSQPERAVYRRVMDWDASPTPFHEFVTAMKRQVGGDTVDPSVINITNDGFASADPLSPPSSGDVDLISGEFQDNNGKGALDDGALFDFDLGSIAPGSQVAFTLFYGAALNRTLAAIELENQGVTAFSFATPSNGFNQALPDGTPYTFMFGYRSQQELGNWLTVPKAENGHVHVIYNPDGIVSSNAVTKTTHLAVAYEIAKEIRDRADVALNRYTQLLSEASVSGWTIPDLEIQITNHMCFGVLALEHCAPNSGYTPAPWLILLKQDSIRDDFSTFATTWMTGGPPQSATVNDWGDLVDHETWHIVQDKLWDGPPIVGGWPILGADYLCGEVLQLRCAGNYSNIIESSAQVAQDSFMDMDNLTTASYYGTLQDLMKNYETRDLTKESAFIGGQSADYKYGAVFQYSASLRVGYLQPVESLKAELAWTLARLASSSGTPLEKISKAAGMNAEDLLASFYATALVNGLSDRPHTFRDVPASPSLVIRKDDRPTTVPASFTRTIAVAQGEVFTVGVPAGSKWAAVTIYGGGADAHVNVVPIGWHGDPSHPYKVDGSVVSYLAPESSLAYGSRKFFTLDPTEPSPGLGVVVVAGTGDQSGGPGNYTIVVDAGSGPRPAAAQRSAAVKAVASANSSSGSVNLLLNVNARGDAGMPLGITANLSDSVGAVTGSSVVATVTDPAGKVRRFTVPDDGLGDDPWQGDGVYGRDIWGTGLPGTYQIEVAASGTDNGGLPYTAAASSSVTLAPAVDSDHDGITDKAEVYLHLNPQDASDALFDADGDGLTLAQELAAGTDPWNADTDGGGEIDSSELARGIDPLVATDDAALPELSILGVSRDGAKVDVGIVTTAASGQVMIERSGPDGTVTLPAVTAGTGGLVDGPLTPGEYLYRAKLVATNGAVGTTVTSGPIVVAQDVAPPQFDVVLNGSALTTTADQVDVWVTSSTEPLTKIRIADSEDALSGTGWLPYDDHTTYHFAGPGIHSVYVEVMDAAGNTTIEKQQIERVALDVTPPVSSVQPLPAIVRSSTLSVPYQATDDASVAQVYLWERFKGPASDAFGDWNVVGEFKASPASISLSDGEGSYEFYTTAVDAAGNVESPPAVADASTLVSYPVGMRPSTRVGQLPATVTDYHFSVPYTAVDNGNGVASVNIWYRFQAAGSAIWGSWTTCALGITSSPANCYLLSGDGHYEFYSIGIDNAGQSEDPPLVADASTILDTYAPSTHTANLPARVSSPSLKVPFAKSDGGGSGITSVELWGSGPAHDYQLLGTGTVSPFSVSLDQGPGEYAFYTIGTDAAGNREGIPCCEGLWWGTKPDARVTLDSTTPVLESQVLPLQNPEVASGSISLEYTAAYPSGSGSVELWQRFEPAGSDTFGSWSRKLTTDAWPISLNLELEGRYEFYTLAVDSLGDTEDPPASADATVLLDHTPPTSTVGALPGTVSTTPYDLQCQASDAGSGVVNIAVWWRWKAHEADPWPDWTTVGNCQPGGDLSVDLWHGEGYYQFASNAVDAIGNAEARPTLPEASTYFGPTPESHIIYAPVGQRPGVLYLSVESNMPYELWERYAPTGSTNFTTWASVGSAAQGDVVPFTIGPEGRYEFYSISVSDSGTRELPPDVADAAVIGDGTRPTSSAGAVVARTSSPTVTVPVTASDGDGSGVSSVVVWDRYRADQNASWGGWNYMVGLTMPASSADISLDWGEGFYQFGTSAHDNAGNYESAITPSSGVTHFTSGNTPSSQVGSLPAATNQTSVEIPYTAEFASGSGTVQLWEHDPTGKWAQVATATAPGKLTAPLLAGEGTYGFYTLAIDTAAGGQEQAPSVPDASIILDTTAPDSATAPSTVLTSQKDYFTLYASSSDPGSGVASVELWWQYASPGSTNFTPPRLAETDPNGFFELAFDSGDGTYRFYSVAIDHAGNREAAPSTPDTVLTLDTVAPTITVVPLTPAVKTTSVSIVYTAADNLYGSGTTGSVDLYRRVQLPGSLTWSNWTWLKTVTASPISTTLPSKDGRYEFYLVPCDNAGNCRAAADSGTVADAFTVLDTKAPVSQVGTIPALISAKTIVLPYTTDDFGGSGVKTVDLYQNFKAPGSSTWVGPTKVTPTSSTSSAITLTLANDGSYQFYTRATDQASNIEAAPATPDASTVLDSTAPVSSVSTLTSPTTASSINVTFAATDTNGSGVNSVDLYERFTTPGGTPPATYTRIVPGATSPVSVPLAADGKYEFYTVATDTAGNVEVAPAPGSPDATVVRDTSAPATIAGPLAPAVSSTTLSVPYTVTAGTVNSVQLYQRWTTPGGNPSGAYTQLTLTPSNGAFTVSLSKGAGRYEFYTIGVGANSTEAAPPLNSPDTFTVLDTTAPTSSATTVASPRTTNTVTITFTASDNQYGSGLAGVDLYQKYTTPGGTPPATYTKIVTGATSPVTVTLGSGDGTYQFYTVARDVAGNIEAAPSSPDATTVLDTTPPASSASALAAGVKTTTLSVPFTASDAATSVTSVQLWQRYTSPGGTPPPTYSKVSTPGTGTSGTFSVTLSLGAGRYEFYTQATDAAGNIEVAPNPPAAPDAFTVLDTTAPISSAGPLTSPIGSTSLSVPYTSSDVNGSGVTKVTLYQSYEAPGSTSWSTYTAVGTPGTTPAGSIAITLGSGSGSYRFYTLATDAATNVEAAPSSPDATTVLDITAPTSTVTALPSTSSAAGISVSYSSADNTGGSGLATTECWYRYRANDPATAGAWTTCGSATTATGTFTVSFASGTGIYDVLTVGVDNLGNREGAAANPPASTVAPKSSVRSIAWTAGVKVNTDTGTAVQDNASYAVGSDGTVYAVWEDSRNGNTDIYFSSRNPSTGVWAAETKLNTDTGTTGQRTPSIAIDGSNNLYVVWADDRNGSTNTDIYFAKRTGTSWSANIKVSDDTTSKIQSAPRISVSSAGVAVAVWYDARSSQVNIYSARLAAGSTTWSTNYNVTTSNTSAVKAAPDVVVASDGTAWATWQDNRTGGGDVYVASLGPTATTWGTNTKVSDDSTTSGLDKSPRIGLTSAGSPVVAYLDGRATNAAVRVVNRNGTTWNASVQVSDTSAKPATGLALAVKADGGVIVAWDDTRSTSAIYGAQCEAGSGTSSVTRCGPVEKWSDQSGASSHPAIMASTTKVYLGWSDATAGNLDIRVRLRNPS